MTWVLDRHRLDVHACRVRCRLHAFLWDEVSEMRRVPEKGDAPQLGNEFLDQLQPLPAEISRGLAQSRDVAPGMPHARHESDLYRIVNVHKDDGHLRRRTPGRKRCRSPSRQNDVDVESHKLCSKAGKLVETPVRGPAFDADVPAVDVSPRPSTLLERFHERNP